MVKIVVKKYFIHFLTFFLLSLLVTAYSPLNSFGYLINNDVRRPVSGGISGPSLYVFDPFSSTYTISAPVVTVQGATSLRGLAARANCSYAYTVSTSPTSTFPDRSIAIFNTLTRKLEPQPLDAPDYYSLGYQSLVLSPDCNTLVMATSDPPPLRIPLPNPTRPAKFFIFTPQNQNQLWDKLVLDHIFGNIKAIDMSMRVKSDGTYEETVFVLNTDDNWYVNASRQIAENYTFKLETFTLNLSNPPRVQWQNRNFITFNDDEPTGDSGRNLVVNSNYAYFLSKARTSPEKYLTVIHLKTLDQPTPLIQKYVLPSTIRHTKAITSLPSDPSNGRYETVFILAKTGSQTTDYSVIEYDPFNGPTGKQEDHICQDAKDLAIDPSGKFIFVSCKYSVVILDTNTLKTITHPLFSFRSPGTITFGN